ncbi:MAG TPA: MoaD/ThiS family protein [Methanolinea sp.]|jgi:molybdopterin synthase sulfur carrier subunit|nr:MAG: ThiS family protein [Methanoregulaceae archaeon PtaB.Bin009]OPY38811.1 MAG: ThiS family protein [Methanoregulaceae archaeon PtaU1.Bin066]HII76961.1 MoaD/ThiS family protein [Methanolinea sp.]HNQ28779.1 MoaD/ThiS family protein [Methanolinea sp.]HNS83573.1 MoaD/ThiS family protein [Methanolinea sp.]
MMSVRVRAFARFRELFGDRLEVAVSSPAMIRDVVMALGQVNADGLLELLDGEGRVKNSVIILVNRERITGKGREEHPVADGDEVAIYPPVAGG